MTRSPSSSTMSATLVGSSLGFGCSNLLGPKSVNEAHTLLRTAYDAGIRHFDVARYYGFGDAESVLGSFLADRRSTVTITTKFGINPVSSLARNRGLVSFARRLMGWIPPLRRLAQSQSKRVVRGGDFSVDAAKRSLDTSLEALNVDTIDVWLLHDCQLEDCSDALYAFLEDAQSSGVIRTFGVGTNAENVADILTHAPAFARVIQLENSVFTPSLARLRREFDLDSITDLVVTHQALSGLGELHRLIHQHPSVAATWSGQLGENVRDRDILASLMLAAAGHENKNGAVLFSSTTPAHIRKNSAVIAEKPFSADQIDTFLALCRSELPSMTAKPQA